MVYRESLKLQSRDRAVSFHDVTQQVKEIAAKSGMKNGICVVYSHHTTCSVITQECAFDMSMTGPRPGSRERKIDSDCPRIPRQSPARA